MAFLIVLTQWYLRRIFPETMLAASPRQVLFLKAALLVFKDDLTSSTTTWANNSCLRIGRGKFLGLKPAFLIAEWVLLLGVWGVVGFGLVGVFFFTILAWDLSSLFRSIQVFLCSWAFSFLRIPIFLCATAIPWLIRFLVLARLKSIFTISCSLWTWQHLAWPDPFSATSSSSDELESSTSWEEFDFALLLNLFAFSLFSFRRLAWTLSGRGKVGIYASRLRSLSRFKNASTFCFFFPCTAFGSQL